MKLRQFASEIFISVLLAVAFQADLIFPDLAYRMGEDLLTLHIPQSMAVARGEARFCEAFGPGFDLLAEGQSGVFSPCHALARAFPGPLGFLLSTLLIQSLTFLGMKRLFRGRGLGEAASWLGSLAYGASLCFLMRVEHFHYFVAVGLFPFLIRGQERLDRRGVALAALAGGQMLLAGAWQIFLMALVALGVNAWLQNTHRVKNLSLIVFLSLALGAVQIEATWGAMQESERAGGTKALEHSLPLKHLAGLVVPLPFGSVALDNYVGGGAQWEFALFASLTAFMLMGFGPLKYRAAFLLFLFLALGEHVPGLGSFHELPPFSYFRVPARWGFVAVFFLACGAARGLERAPWRMSSWRVPLWCWPPLGFLVALTGAGLGAGGPRSFGESVAHWVRTHSEGEKIMRPWPDLMERLASAGEGLWWQCAIGVGVVAILAALLRSQRTRWVPLLVLGELLASAYAARTTVDMDELKSQAFPPELKGNLFIPQEERRRIRMRSLERGDGWLADLASRKPFMPSMVLGLPHRDLLHHSPLHSRRLKEVQHWVSLASGHETWLGLFQVSACLDHGTWIPRSLFPGLRHMDMAKRHDFPWRGMGLTLGGMFILSLMAASGARSPKMAP